MRTTGLEEHFAIREVLDAWPALPPGERDLAFVPSTQGVTGRRLLDLGADRISAMDATGLDVQVLSLNPPGVQGLPESTAVQLQRLANDRLAEHIAHQPDRFQGLAALAASSPDAALPTVRRVGHHPERGARQGLIFSLR